MKMKAKIHPFIIFIQFIINFKIKKQFKFSPYRFFINHNFYSLFDSIDFDLIYLIKKCDIV